MGTKQRKALPWGLGIDRASGAMVVNEEQFSDLRNVYLTNGRAELRKGLSRALLVSAGDDLLGVWPIRAQGLAGALVYKALDRTVNLWVIDSTGTNANFVATIWTLSAAATLPPQVLAADSYDKLIIAHDEPLYGLRQSTYVFAPADGTVLPLMADFARTGTPAEVKFRGVARHLNYLVGWGYGTSLDEDRGETLRISEAGDPTEFKPEHYFLVGAQGDPIIGCGFCGGALAVLKIADSHKLIGYDRATFGIRPLDPSYGLLASRLHVSVNEELHFWSMSGPRVSSGDGSNDLGAPLALEGAVPDVNEPNTPKDKGFAYYDATNREIVYVFGQWGYVLHLRDGQKKWSYRFFGRPLVSAGSIYTGGSLLINITAVPTIDATLYGDISPTPSYVGTDTKPKLRIRWSIAGPITTERLEVWVKSARAGATWSRRGSFLPSALGGDITVNDALTTYSVAIRLTQSGYSTAAYSNTLDPSTWPATAKASFNTTGEIVQWFEEGWHRFDANNAGFIMNPKAPGYPGGGDPLIDISYTVERRLYGDVTWIAVNSGYNILQTSDLALPNAIQLTQQEFRIKAVGPVGVSSWYYTPPLWVSPEPPSNVVAGVTNLPGGPNTGSDIHNVTWAAPLPVNGFAVADGPFELRARHRDKDPGINVGAYSAMQQMAAGVHATTAAAPGYDPSTGVGRRYEVQVRSRIVHPATSVVDVSVWILAYIDEA